MSYGPARLHRLAELIPWNQFLGSIKLKKFVLRTGILSKGVYAEKVPFQLKSSLFSGRKVGFATGRAELSAEKVRVDLSFRNRPPDCVYVVVCRLRQ